MWDWIYVALGLVLLLFAGDALVRGAVNMSLRLGVPALIVSLTIVAFGTSAPELLISIQSIFDGVPGLALGNVVGSNTANVLLVLGIPALLAAMHTQDCDTRSSYLQMLGATGLFILLCFMGPFTWTSGLILLAALAAMLIWAGREASKHRATGAGDDDDDIEGADPSLGWAKISFFLIAGLIGLPLGAKFLVDGSTSIARGFGVSETVIGLTLVAVGTSLPELATTVAAALRGQADVALGNVIGSNMFNLLGIMGVASLFGTIPVDPDINRFDVWIMLAATLGLIPFVFFKVNISRFWGAIVSVAYVIYIIVVLA